MSTSKLKKDNSASNIFEDINYDEHIDFDEYIQKLFNSENKEEFLALTDMFNSQILNLDEKNNFFSEIDTSLHIDKVDERAFHNNNFKHLSNQDLGKHFDNKKDLNPPYFIKANLEKTSLIRSKSPKPIIETKEKVKNHNEKISKIKSISDNFNLDSFSFVKNQKFRDQRANVKAHFPQEIYESDCDNLEIGVDNSTMDHLNTQSRSTYRIDNNSNLSINSKIHKKINK